MDCSESRRPAPALAPMLLQQLHVGDGHAPIDGFDHVVNRQQGDLGESYKSTT